MAGGSLRYIFYENLQKTDYTVAGEDEYLLHAEYLKNSDPTTKYVILSYGYTNNRIGSLKYVPMYLELGYNCIIYDHVVHDEEKLISIFSTEEKTAEAIEAGATDQWI